MQAIRCLKRRISDAVYRQLLADGPRRQTADADQKAALCQALKPVTQLRPRPFCGLEDRSLVRSFRVVVRHRQVIQMDRPCSYVVRLSRDHAMRLIRKAYRVAVGHL
jgi:hypothetical protein